MNIEISRFEEELASITELKSHSIVIRPFGNAPVIDLRQLRSGRLFIPVERLELKLCDVDEKTIDKISKFRNLKSLTLNHCNIEKEGDLRILSSLESICFRHTNSETGDLPSLPVKNLRELWIDDASGFRGDVLKGLRDAKSLKNLYIYDADLTLSTRIENISLTSLQLASCKVAASFGTELDRLTQLEVLVCEKVDGLSSQALMNLANANVKSLRTVVIVGTGIDDDFVKAIAKLPNLLSLAISECSIDDAIITNLEAAPALRILDLTGNRITNNAFSTLRKISTLETVFVMNTSVSYPLDSKEGILDEECTIWHPAKNLEKPSH